MPEDLDKLSNMLPIVARPQRLSETQMAEALNVSRTPVREAIARLRQQRLLISDASGVHRVADWDRKTLWEISTLRVALESLAFSLAPDILTEEDYRHLEEIIQQMGEMDADPSSGDYKRMALYDYQFHTCIWSRTGHELLEQALENIKPQAHFYMFLTRQSGQTDYAEKHRILIEFLKKGDRSNVNEIMLDHILPSSEKAIAWWERRQEEISEGKEGP